MPRSRSDVVRVFDLADAGWSKRSISLETGVSRASIREWLNDREVALARTSRTSGLTSLSCAGACEPWTDVLWSQYAYLLGMYLGDGCISRHPRAYRLRISCTEIYPKIMDEVDDAIRAVLHGVTVGRVNRKGCVEVGAYSCHWPCYFPQHGPGVKHLRPIILEPWQREIVEAKPRPLIRGLIHSDGWRGDNVAIKHAELAIEYRTYTRYQFSNRSDDIRALFCWALDLVGVHWTRSNQWTISVSRRKDVHYLDSFVGPKR